MTLQDILAEATARLDAAHLAYGHGTTNAHDEAAWLVLWRLGLPLDTDLNDQGNKPVKDADAEAVRELIVRRIETRKPAAYLTGEAWLQGVPFHVDERVIVPRSFIAELIAEGGFDAWLSPDTRHVLDLCTGNGSLAVLAAMAWPEIRVIGADISPDALAVAHKNVARHGLQDRITLLESDGLARCPGPWDLILCNPPYVNAGSMAVLPAEYRAEPEIALAGGDDGMDFVRTLFRDAPSRMSANAVMVLEIGNEKDHFEHAFPGLDVVWLSTSAGDEQLLLVTAESLRRFHA
ncbi:50S ribosomal protein L3 N(5)-glutamine methyltransferase [Hydrogenophaga bisanensis]|uniref:50S ribosomal protein L3 N(5)-glutamine methyltransferase n=1 Tax=Hydrogenophaga bisanensis TaxID=439611 RepID=A0ABW2RCF4_9BURK